MDKRFPGTPKHIEKLRKEGVVPDAPIFFLTIPLIIGVAAGGLLWEQVATSVKRMTTLCWGGGDEDSLQICLRAVVISGWPEWVGAAGAISFVSLFVSWWVKRPTVQLSKMGIDLSRLGGGGWLQKIRRSPILFAGYAVVYGSGIVLLWWLARGDLFLGLLSSESGNRSTLVTRVVIGSVGWLLCMGGFSGALGWYGFRKKTMMSEQQLRQEQKEDSGDPQLRGHRRQLHQAILREQLVQAVRRSAVVVVAPMAMGEKR